MIGWLTPSYDEYVFPFSKLVHDHLGVRQLTDIHLDYDIAPLSADTEQSTPVHKLLYSISDEFFHVYRRFVAQWVQPLVGEEVVFQAVPNFRFQAPASKAVFSWHRDRDNGHSPESINIWVPLTPTTKENCVWIEGAPGSEDFRPVSVPVGRALVFDAANLRHGNVTNTSSSTRVSFEFRVVRASRYQDRDEKSVLMGKRFALGDYFDRLTE